MKALHIRKRFILTVLCAILLIMLCAPIYSQKSSQNQGFDNAARIDIHNRRKAENSVTIIEPNLSAETKINYPSWCKSKSGQCAKIEGKVNSKWKTFVIKFKVNGDGNVTVMLRGPDVSKKGKRYPLYVDYRAVSLNQHKLLDESTSFWHDKPYKHTLKMKNGEIAELKFAARSHVLSWRELSNSVNYLLLFSVLVLSFLLSYKAVQYVSKFKLMENYSRIDIVFVVVFVALLFVPMSRISTAQKSMQENRMLAKYPQLLTKSLNLEYGRQFEKWFNDRFFGREEIIRIHTDIMYNINNIYQNNKAMFFKKSGWMFGKPLAINCPSNQEIEQISAAIKKFDNFCEKNNIRLYIIVVPQKGGIYKELLQDYGYDTKKEIEFRDYIKQIQKSLSKKRIVRPHGEMRKGQKNDFVFFKQAHHWTDYGAYLGYELLAERILQDFKEFKKVSLHDFKLSHSNLVRDDWNRKYNRGHTSKLLNITDKPDAEILNTIYNYYDPKQPDAITKKQQRYIKLFKNKAAPNNYRLFMTGNSQNENLLQFMVSSVKEIKYLRLNMGQQSHEEQFKFIKYYKKELLDFKPDIMVVTISDSTLKLLRDFVKD